MLGQLGWPEQSAHRGEEFQGRLEPKIEMWGTFPPLQAGAQNPHGSCFLQEKWVSKTTSSAVLSLPLCDQIRDGSGGM